MVFLVRLQQQLADLFAQLAGPGIQCAAEMDDLRVLQVIHHGAASIHAARRGSARMVAQGGGKLARQAIESSRAGRPAQNPAWADNDRKRDYGTDYQRPRRNAARDSDRTVQDPASGGKCGGRFRDQGALRARALLQRHPALLQFMQNADHGCGMRRS
jgi:hypothetical protein